MKLYKLIFPALLLAGLVVTACSAPVGPQVTDDDPNTGQSQGSSTENTVAISPDSVETQTVEFTFAGETAAPDFPIGFDWLNVDRELSIPRDLAGKIVLLDFWTLGCINCIHIIPDLTRLENEYADSLVVIGVHSAKFQTEGETESIRQAVLRYGLEHPVVNDQNMTIWRRYGARAWPTLILIDPLGNVVGYHAGEGVYQVFKPVIEVMDREFKQAGYIDSEPLSTRLERNSSPPTVLSFPGKVLADPIGERLFIADSNHDRVLISDPDGVLQMAIGSGERGFLDGDFESARFFTPLGLALSADGTTLYIADMNNHAVRAADLINRVVYTISGTGQQAFLAPNGSKGLATDLSSPWDLLLADNSLYIAMAGLHQLWVHDLQQDEMHVFVGSGREGIDDGDPRAATLAQPSGLSTDGKILFFTDPETSAVRMVPLDGSGPVETIIGTGLFDFGDQDGEYPNARLQHALGITFYDDKLYVADTYNHKIKIIDPKEKTSQTWIGNGDPGWADGPGAAASLAEPSGLSILGDKLYIADTNNHLVRVADLQTGELNTLTLSNLEVARTLSNPGLDPQYIELDPRTVGPGNAIIQFNFTVPDGYQFNDYGPFTLDWSATAQEVVRLAEGDESHYEQAGPEFPIRFPVDLQVGETRILTQTTAFYCRIGEEALCLVEDVNLALPLTVQAGADGGVIQIDHQLPPLETEN